MQYSKGIKMPSINQAVCFNCSSVEKCPYCVSCFFTLIPGSVVQLCMFIAFGYGIISSFLHAFVNQGNSLKNYMCFFHIIYNFLNVLLNSECVFQEELGAYRIMCTLSKRVKFSLGWWWAFQFVLCCQPSYIYGYYCCCMYDIFTHPEIVIVNVLVKSWLQKYIKQNRSHNL